MKNTNCLNSILKKLKPFLFITILSFSACKKEEELPVEVELSIGDLHEGGIIFWLENGDEHGIVASLKDLPSSVWSDMSNLEIGSSANDMANGTSNTQAIINQQGHTTSAAKLCDDYAVGGYNDWYLPSLIELEEFKNSLLLINSVLGNSDRLKYNVYWSSTESGYNRGRIFGFDGTVGASMKGDVKLVRAVRKF
jgi:hypothetical protein